MSGQQSVAGGRLRAFVLVLATLTTGLTAGAFLDWSNAIMPGLREVDDRTFVVTFRALDAAITSPLFIGVEFTGAILLTGLSAALHRHKDYRPTFIWVSVALGFYFVAVMITFAVHEPLNEKLRAAGELESSAQYAAARAVLEESMWTAWNTVRAVASTVAFGCLAWALAVHPRYLRDQPPHRSTGPLARHTSGATSPST